MTEPQMTPAKATALRKPFPPESIGKLPKGGQMLDYAGHAAVTDRLLAVDPMWSWEPFAVGPEGLPALDHAGNLWIRLTVCGVTRIGVGDGKNAKEAIGDAIRNAAMRFGVALDLWAKENLVEFAQALIPPTTDTTAAYVNPPRPDQPTHDTETGLPIDYSGPMQPKTRGHLFALLTPLEPDEVKQRKGISDILGHQIASRGDLTEDQAQKVIAVLKTHPKPPPRDPGAVTKTQLTKLGKLMDELEITTRDERLGYVASIIGHDVSEATELTKPEAEQVIEALAAEADLAKAGAKA